ncbi:MAG: SRPBCC family protein [Tepidiformaceae bacterium]
MSVHRLDATQVVPIELDEAWSFFSDPGNLSLITPPWLGFTITSPDLPPRVYEGLIIAYTVRPVLNVPVRWVAEITHVREREYFVDEQRSGPYAFWHHQHHFRLVDGGTEVRDTVHYAAPLGPLGDLVVRFQVKGKLDQIFAYRRKVLERRFGSTRPAPGTLRA